MENRESGSKVKSQECICEFEYVCWLGCREGTREPWSFVPCSEDDTDWPSRSETDRFAGVWFIFCLLQLK